MSKYKNHYKKDHLMTIKDCHLRNIGVSSTDDINHWFKKSFSNGYWIKDIDKLIAILSEFKDKVVYIFGDYDADGITGTSIYYRALKWAGFNDVRFQIPKRIDGFGVNKKMVDEAVIYLKSKDLTPNDCVILTVDNGTAAISPIAYAKSLGFTVLVTDHHEPHEENGEIVLPDADVVINPNAIPNSATFNGCCGAGVAFKVSSALLNDKKKIDLLRPLAMVGTFCDVMDLKEENYVIAYQGLKTLNDYLDYNIPAFKALAKTLGIAHWDGMSVGFKVGPCLNALERLEDGAAKKGVELLISNDIDECLKLSGELLLYNESRKIESDQSLKMLEEKIASMPNGPGYPIVIYLPNTKAGLVGILAGKLQEKYKAPAGVFTDAPNGMVKGSFRAPEGFNIKEHLDMIAEHFDHVGGHAGAAGAGLLKSNFDNMVKALQETVPHVDKATEDDNYYYDIEISNNDLEKAIIENEKFQPLGKGNEDLKFKVTDFNILPINGSYFKETKKSGVQFKSETSSAIGFDLINLARTINKPCKLTLYGNIAYNRWVKNDGTVVVTPQVIFDDFEIHYNEVKKSPLAERLMSKAANR